MLRMYLASMKVQRYKTTAAIACATPTKGANPMGLVDLIFDDQPWLSGD